MVTLDLITSENIQLALEAYYYFAENPAKTLYGSVNKDDLFDFILDVTKQDDLQKAIPVLREILTKKYEEQNITAQVPRQPTSTIPINIDDLVKALQQYQETKNASKSKDTGQPKYDVKWMIARKKLLNEQEKQNATPQDIADKVTEVVAVPIIAATQKEDLIKRAKENPDQFANETAIAIASSIPAALTAELTAETVVDRVQKLSKDYTQKIAKLGDAPLPILTAEKINSEIVNETPNIENLIVTLPVEIQVSRELTRQFVEENPERFKKEALPLIPVIPTQESINKLPTEVLQRTQDLVEQLAGNETANVLLPNIPKVTSEAIAAEAIPVSGFFANPTVVSYGIKELAKEEGASTVTATALMLSSQKVEDLQRMGFDPQILKLYKDRLESVERAGGKLDWIKKAVAAQGLFNEEQVRIINSQASGIQSYAVFNKVFTPFNQSFIGRIGSELGQRFIGGIAKNFIKNSLGLAAKKFVQNTASSIALKIAGTALAPIVGPLASLAINAWTGIRNNVGKALTLAGVGAAIGGLIAGPAGLLVGGLLGASLSNVDLKKAALWIAEVAAAIFAVLFGAIAVPIALALIVIPIMVALTLFIINSGAYVVPPGFSSGGILAGPVRIVCNANQTDTSTSGSTAANAAACIVSYLNQFNLNPLFADMVNSPSWQNLANVLAKPALDPLSVSAVDTGHLQCVGFVAATAGLAYGQSFNQINACSYIGNPPAGYTYVPGTLGIKSGDFFVMQGNGGCRDSSPGHIGVVVSVDGALISCADANYIADGKARTAHGCFALTQIAGYLRK